MDDGPAAPSTADVVAVARRFQRRLRRRLNEALEDVGVTYAQFEVLEALGADPDLHAGAIAHRLDTSRQAVHLLVRKLTDAGCMEPLVRDAGVLGLQLTDRGRGVLARCDDALRGLHLLFERLPAASRRDLYNGLNSASAALMPFPSWTL